MPWSIRASHVNLYHRCRQRYRCWPLSASALPASASASGRAGRVTSTRPSGLYQSWCPGRASRPVAYSPPETSSRSHPWYKTWCGPQWRYSLTICRWPKTPLSMWRTAGQPFLRGSSGGRDGLCSARRSSIYGACGFWDSRTWERYLLPGRVQDVMNVVIILLCFLKQLVNLFI